MLHIHRTAKQELGSDHPSAYSLCVRLIAVTVVLAAVLSAGCGDSGGDISKLERELSRLRADNARLAAQVADLRGDLLARVATTRRSAFSNDKALLVGVEMAQFYVLCGTTPQPGCHVPIGSPGTVYEDSRGRIRATPFP